MNREAAGLYIHVPFCSAVCPYCDFAVLRGDENRRRSYVDSLLAEIASWRDHFEPVDTVYFGGGTPSLLTVDQIAEILEALREAFVLLPDTFLTMEFNPEDARPKMLRELRRLGFGMISLGVQSFAPASLTFLGRRHSAAQGKQSVLDARESGFEIVSLDLIYGLPGQGRKEWIKELDTALDLRPDHLSCYQLTLEPGTSFGKRASRGAMKALAENDQADLFLETHRRLQENGFGAYEVSNFARSEQHRSPHNRKYWRHTPYLGLGPSAHSFRDKTRWWNHRHLETWKRELASGRAAIAETEELSEAQLALEFLMLSLRQPTGVDLDAFVETFGCELLEGNRQLLERLEAETLLEVHGRRLRPSLRGLAVAEGLASSFVLSPSLARTP